MIGEASGEERKDDMTVPGGSSNADASTQKFLARRPAYLALIALLVISIGGWQLRSNRLDQRSNPGEAVSGEVLADFDYIVPLGTSSRAAAGETIEIMPAELQARVGQVIRIRNLDRRAVDVGPFRVPAQSTLVQRFTKPGTFIGVCVLSPTGSARIVVE